MCLKDGGGSLSFIRLTLAVDGTLACTVIGGTRTVPLFTIGNATSGSLCATVSAGTTSTTAIAGNVVLCLAEAYDGL